MIRRWLRPVRALRRLWYRRTTAEVTALREAIDDLWCCITHGQISYLQPETVTVAKQNHELLWHPAETEL